MDNRNRNAFLALATAGALWGLTVPLSKLALAWLGPGWLTVARFGVAAPLLAVAGRRGLREALVPRVAAAGAIGFGAVILLQNAGIEQTSVSHAAVIVGAVPVLVAVIAAGLGHASGPARTWGGYALALGGVALVAGSGGGGATPVGDLLVLASVGVSAAVIVAQPRLLAGRDAAAVTAVQFAAAALVATPVAVVTQGTPAAPGSAAPAMAFVALSLAGTLLPFWLFAYGQARVPARLAGAFVNLEPVVGAAVGWLAFGDPAASGQIAGAVAVLAGIALSTLPASATEERMGSARGPGERSQCAWRRRGRTAGADSRLLSCAAVMRARAGGARAFARQACGKSGRPRPWARAWRRTGLDALPGRRGRRGGPRGPGPDPRGAALLTATAEHAFER
jgi:O-acetylserine/cysteine efflux transporter